MTQTSKIYTPEYAQINFRVQVRCGTKAEMSLSTPQLGLVCITHGNAVRYRTLTRTRYLAFENPGQKFDKLLELYTYNLEVLYAALEFCTTRKIGIYRITSDLFPLADWGDGVGFEVLETLKPRMAGFGLESLKRGIRVVIHPDQFVVLNSTSKRVVRNSLKTLWYHAQILDWLSLPRSSWTVMNIHGGKGGRSAQMIEIVRDLPDNIRSRLTLENDEYTYSAAQISNICLEAGIAMVFDVHHHIVREKLTRLDHPSIAAAVQLARATWNPKAWQLVHISSGKTGLHDAKHHALILEFPQAFRSVGYVEVEAKTKEIAIEDLQARLEGRESTISLEALVNEPVQKRTKKSPLLEVISPEIALEGPVTSPDKPKRKSKKLEQ